MGNNESSPAKLNHRDSNDKKKGPTKTVTIGACERVKKYSNDQLKSNSFNEADMEFTKIKEVQRKNVNIQRSSASFNTHVERIPSIKLNRRTKSFRAGHGNTGSFGLRNGLGTAAELTTTQKNLIQGTFVNIDIPTFYLFGHIVFVTIFSRDKRLLQVIGLEDFEYSDNSLWEQHINFKLHNQRFCETLIECIEHIHDDSLVLDRLREFGASYALNQNAFKGVPMNFWDRLQAAIFNAARELKYSNGKRIEISLLSDNDPITNETTKDKSVSPNISISSAISNFNFKGFELNSDTTSSHSSSDIPPLSPHQKKNKNVLTNRGQSMKIKKDTKTTVSTVLSNSSNPTSGTGVMDRLSPDGTICSRNDCTPRRSFKYSPLNSSICPIKAQAWGCFSLFVAEQIRFGYELEIILQDEMKRLGLKNISIEQKNIATPKPNNSPKQKAPFYTVSC
uniref:GLOBIN domain-containing protein n=1 Tax=Parastrongyloides trichosuri TaxID=131310 RepID=A0A0N4Z8W9_PARTI